MSKKKNPRKNCHSATRQKKNVEVVGAMRSQEVAIELGEIHLRTCAARTSNQHRWQFMATVRKHLEALKKELKEEMRGVERVSRTKATLDIFI